MQGTWVQSLVRELRSDMLHGQNKRKKSSENGEIWDTFGNKT